MLIPWRVFIFVLGLEEFHEPSDAWSFVGFWSLVAAGGG